MKSIQELALHAAQKFEEKLYNSKTPDSGKVGVIHQYTVADGSELLISISREK